MNYVKRLGFAKPSAGDFGIEIETESANSYPVPRMSYWKCDTDGSLRNFGIEYILRKPINYKEVDSALEEFSSTLVDVKFLDSVYTSIHVHVNISRMTLSEIASFYTAYCLFEEVLTRYCGPTRNGNLFCLKNSLANRGVNTLSRLYRTIDSGDLREIDNILCNGTFNENQLKYAACNIATMCRFQSLEIRTHKGTTNVAEIKRWIDIIECIKTFSMQFKPNEIIKYFYQEKNKLTIMRSIFGDLNTYLVTDNLDRDLSVGLFYALQIAKSSSKWDKLDKLIEEKVKILGQDSVEKKSAPRQRDARTNEEFDAQTRQARAAMLNAVRQPDTLNREWGETVTINARTTAATDTRAAAYTIGNIVDEFGEDF